MNFIVSKVTYIFDFLLLAYSINYCHLKSIIQKVEIEVIIDLL